MALIKSKIPQKSTMLTDVTQTAGKMDTIMYGLTMCTGVRGFYCIFKSDADVVFDPSWWYFMDPELNVYLNRVVRKEWDIQTIGGLVEAFAVAGCDFMKFLCTAKDCADYLKAEICDLVQLQLGTLIINFKPDFVVKYGINIFGWTLNKFVNPSEMSTSLPPLRKLVNALKSGLCKFIHLSKTDQKAREAAYFKKVNTSEVVVCNECQDKGLPRGKHSHDNGEVNEDSETETQPSEKCCCMSCPKAAGESKQTAPKSMPFVDNPDVSVLKASGHNE
ncbi:uncharacterized protein C8Q71DRAFT_726622 [Rhodofomes roseus]|uniref:Uncharacterized protein n=1 Tax=Rhodofomes roseus TaxID=34475 RepID=A0ABQ8K4B3_9APHY|nr:uncharacterized protein C8Q71DRAFT_726622 [Rhodofomes roseus]KAH9831728.1 hypothetical protein C8Q71DRAFT_726622 [Rhodofomes roseus]